MTSAPSELRERIARWHRTGEVGALWPDLSSAERRLGHAQVLAITRAILVGTATRPSLDASSQRDGTALGVAAYAAGMGPLLGWWIERGQVTASPAARHVLALHLHHGRRRITALLAEMGPILEAFQAQGIVPTVLKGMHTGGVYFPEPGTRPTADIDLLVRPAEVAGAESALRQAGLRQVRRTAFADRSEWAPADRPREVQSLELDHEDSPWTVDLHQALERWYFRGLRVGFGADAFTNTEPWSRASGAARVLGQPQLAAFLALHASYELSRMRLVRLVELIEVIRADVAAGSLGWNDLASFLQRRQMLRFVYPALDLAERLRPDTVDPELLQRARSGAPARLRRVVDAVAAAGMALLEYRSLDDRLMWARGAREVWWNLTDLAWPTDDGGPSIGRLYWRRARGLALGIAGVRARAYPPARPADRGVSG